MFELLGGDIPSIRSDEFGVQGIAQFNEHLDVEGGVRELSRTQRSLRPVRGAVALLEFKAELARHQCGQAYALAPQDSSGNFGVEQRVRA